MPEHLVNVYMDSETRQALRSIVRYVGIEILNKPLLLRGLLASACADDARGIELLLIALAENIPRNIINSNGNEPGYRLVKNFLERLGSTHMMSEEEAMWAINSWIYALEIAPEDTDSTAIQSSLSREDLDNYSVNNYHAGMDLQFQSLKPYDQGSGTYRADNGCSTDSLNDTANNSNVSKPNLSLIEADQVVIKPDIDERQKLPAQDVKVDNVHFTITSLKAVNPGDWFIIDVWAHLGTDREDVLKRARDEYGTNDITNKSRGPIRISRSTILSVRLEIIGAVLENPEEKLLWDGEISNAGFRVKTDLKEGLLQGLAMVSIDSLQIARLYFNIDIGKGGKDVQDLHLKEEVHRKAFVSYASEDRDRVLARIQGIKKVAPQIEIFMDVLSLRSGDYWEQELWKVIPANDVFYLFWSQHALNSSWVEKEWRCALLERGIDFIDPIPLVSPTKAPPPQELSKKHFNEPLLAFLVDKNWEEFDF